MTTEFSVDRTEAEHIKPARRWLPWDVSLGYGSLMLIVGLTVIFIGKTLLMSKPAATHLPIVNNEPRTTMKSEPTVRLPSAEQFEGVPSVTDHTTRHLEPTPIERKTE